MGLIPGTCNNFIPFRYFCKMDVWGGIRQFAKQIMKENVEDGEGDEMQERSSEGLLSSAWREGYWEGVGK